MRSNFVLAALAITVVVAGCHRGSEPPAAQPQIETPPPAVAEQTPPAQAPVNNPSTVDTAPPPPVRPPVPAPAPTPAATAAENPPAPKSDPNAKPAEPPVDPLKWLADREARAADYKQRVAKAEADLAVATASVADWEKTVLAFENPFRPRPQLSGDDATAIASMDGTQRVRWAKGRLEAARRSRDAAQKTLDDLKANPPPE